MDTLQLECRLFLVGHSIGARPTLEVALLAPDRIAALVLVDGALGFNNGGDIEQNDPSFLVRTFFCHPPAAQRRAVRHCHQSGNEPQTP